MSGGSWEYVMGNYNDIIGKSGFILMPESKYYNKYTSDNIMTTCDGKECISHGLSETSEWYDDYYIMVNEMYPWLLRGGYYSNSDSAGVFLFYLGNVSGDANTGGSFRLVMTPSL